MCALSVYALDNGQVYALFIRIVQIMKTETKEALQTLQALKDVNSSFNELIEKMYNVMAISKVSDNTKSEVKNSLADLGNCFVCFSNEVYDQIAKQIQWFNVVENVG